MASAQSDQERPKKEAGEASVSGHPQPDGQQPPANGNPPMMGYPPAMGYPPQPGYPHQVYPYAYPDGYNNNNYPNPQAPPAGYYNPQMYPAQRGYRSSGFARGMFLGLVFLIFFMCMTSFIVWLVLRPELPTFHVDSFSVSNFNATPPGRFTGNWDANVSIHNPNTKLEVVFGRVEAHVCYENDILLASSFVHPFSLETKASNAISARLSADGISPLDGDFGSSLVNQLAKDRNTGTVTFDLRMELWTTFKNSWWTRHATLRVFCEEMKVAFVGATGNGNLAVGNLSDCTVV